MVRNVHTTTTNGLRKNRITQKTRLRVVRGQLDADAIILDDEEERNRVLASQGVDAEDANEHHLLAALNAAHHQHRKESRGHHKHSEAHIPIPDAAGVVAGYEALYQSGKYREPTTHLRFSDTVEETVENGLAGGFAYFLEERDAEWIKKNNQEARGEGTSASAGGGVNGQAEDTVVTTATRSGRALHGRNIKGKGKEPEQAFGNTNGTGSSSSSSSSSGPGSNINGNSNATCPRIVVDEDEFELVMGVFEKITEDKFPFIHLALDSFPPFSDYEPVFAAPLPPATFATYIVPSSVPPPERLVCIARAVYPYWKERKVEREGKRVVPQLDYDDTQESSYICFRRRDAKPVRRTRASSTAYTDKLSRLRAELQMGFDLTRMVLEREELKREQVSATRAVWQGRGALVKAWKSEEGVKGPDMVLDEALLHDKERVAKKAKVEAMGRMVAAPRRSSGLPSMEVTPIRDSHSPLAAHLELPGINLNTLSPVAYVAVQSAVKERYMDIQANVEKEMASLRARDAGWEDLVDMPVQSLPVTSPEKFYRPCPPPSSYSSPAAPIVDPSGDSHLFAASEPTQPPPDSLLSREAPDSTNEHTNPFDGPLSATHSPTKRLPRSLRLRTGRGGRLQIDRLLQTRQINPLLRAERARWPPTSKVADRRRETRDSVEEARWKNRDWRPENMFPVGLKKVADADDLRQKYWAHESVYMDDVPSSVKRKREENEEDEEDEEEEVVGFEQIKDGLELWNDAEWEKGPAEDTQWKLEPRSRSRPRAKIQKTTEHKSSEEFADGAPADCAWRIDERWRYDSDTVRDEEDRFLLDDYQPKFLRTMVTLLSASDHEAIKTDAKYLTPPLIPNSGPKPFPSPSHSTEQERTRLWRALRAPAQSRPQSQGQFHSHPPARPQGQGQQSQSQASLPLPHPPAIPKLPQQQVPSTPSPVPLSLPQQQAASSSSGSSVATADQTEEQIRRMARQPQPQPQPQPLSESSVPAAVPVPAQVSPRIAVTQQQQQQQQQLQQGLSPGSNGAVVANGFHSRPMSLGNGLSAEDAATVRVSSVMRPKVHTPGLQHQGGALGVNGFANNVHVNGAFAAHQAQNPTHGVMHSGHTHGLNPQQYAALRNVFGVQQHQQHQHQQHQQHQHQQHQHQQHQHQQHQHQQLQQLQGGRQQMAMQMQMNGVSGNGNINLQMGPGNLNLKLPASRPQMRMNGNAGGSDVNGVNVNIVGGSPVPMHATPPRVNMAGSPVPQARAPSANGHLMAPGHGRASPANGHLLGGHASPHGHHAAHPSPHLQSGLVALPLHTTATPPRPAPPFMHQQMVGAAGQGHEYS